MLSIADKLQDYSITTNDGEIGKVISLLFDDRDWSVKYIVVDAGDLTEHKVLLSTEIVDIPIWDKRESEAELFEVYDEPGYWI